VQLSQGQFDALVSFAYNVGVGAFGKSTLLKRVNAGRFEDVPAEFMKWTRGGGIELSGLVRRRRAEVKLWRSLNTEMPISYVEARTRPDEPAPKKSIVASREANGAVIAGAGGIAAAAQEIIPAIKDGSDLVSSLSSTAILCIIVVIAAAAIWYFRKQRLEEE
jgi:lysozyme